MTTQTVYTINFSSHFCKDVLNFNIMTFLLETIKNSIILIAGKDYYRDNVTIKGDPTLISVIESSNEYHPNYVNSIFDDIDFKAPIGTFCGCKVIRDVFATKQYILIEVDMMGHIKELLINFT